MSQTKLFFILLIATAGLVVTQPAVATTIISPVLELQADPGTVQPGVVKVYNETNHQLSLTSSVEQFTAGADDGQPAYIPSDQHAEFLRWFKLGQTAITLAPGQAAVIPFVVTIPKTAVPGGYYAAIFWEESVPKTAGQPTIGVRGKVGTLVFLRVNGQVSEIGRLDAFGLKDNVSVYYRLPVTLVSRFTNAGNVFLQPHGTITLRSSWGGTTVLPLGDGQAYVLPGSTRRFEVVWGQTAFSKNWLQAAWQEFASEAQQVSVGHYVATLNVRYGLNDQQQLTQQISFWVIPYHLIIGTALVLIGLIFSYGRKRSKKNRQAFSPTSDTSHDSAAPKK